MISFLRIRTSPCSRPPGFLASINFSLDIDLLLSPRSRRRPTLPFQLPKLYPITDRRLSGLSHAEQVRRLSAGGATFIQLREKHLDAREFYVEAKAALDAARACGVRLIINDRVDIALAFEVDGVHLGQDDLPPDAARRILGERAIIGFSTHNIEQAKQAMRLPVDYIAIGPVFATSSKENPDPALGLEAIKSVRAIVHTPLVAIGGITAETAPDVLAAGIDSVAVISLLLNEPHKITERTRQLFSLLC